MTVSVERAIAEADEGFEDVLSGMADDSISPILAFFSAVMFKF
jgi:hypothetical protein